MNKFRVLRPFGYNKRCEVGEVIELNDNDAQRLSHLIGKLEDSNYGEDKPNTKLKRGRKKGMKRLFCLMLFLGIAGLVKAEDYTVNLSSYVLTGGATSYLATYPNIAGPVMIDKLIFTTTGTLTTPMLLGIYDTSRTTTTASLAAYFVIGTTSTAVGSAHTLVIDYPYYNPLKLVDPAFFKADGDISYRVYLNVQYR